MNIKENPGTIRVSKIYSKSGQIESSSEETNEIDLPRMNQEAPICTVSIDKSLTKNLGNYNSFKVGAFVSVPAYLDDGQIESAFTYARQRVDSAIKTALIDEGLDNA